MRYFHRTSLSPDDVLHNADKHFATTGALSDSGTRSRVFKGPAGQIALSVELEGGHYTRVTIETDHPYQDEADKVAKGFFKTLHAKVHAAHH